MALLCICIFLKWGDDLSPKLLLLGIACAILCPLQFWPPGIPISQAILWPNHLEDDIDHLDHLTSSLVHNVGCLKWGYRFNHSSHDSWPWMTWIKIVHDMGISQNRAPSLMIFGIPHDLKPNSWVAVNTEMVHLISAPWLARKSTTSKEPYRGFFLQCFINWVSTYPLGIRETAFTVILWG